MPKKKRSKGDNVIPHKVTERYKWKCDIKGCKVEGTAYTKQDAKTALLLHKAGAH